MDKKKKTIMWIVLSLLVVAILVVVGFFAFKPEPEPPVEPSEPEISEPPAPVEPEWEPGKVIANYAEALYKTFALGSKVEVTGQYKDYYIVKGEDHDLLLEKRFVRLDSDDAYSSWTGYAYSEAEAFSSVYMRNEPIATLSTNTEITVEDGKGEWLKISWEDGKGYMLKSDVSKSKISSGGGGGYTESKPSQDVSDGTDVDLSDLSAKNNRGGLVPLGKYYGPAAEDDFTPGNGTVIAEDVEAYLLLFMRDDEVKVTEYDEEYCTIWIEEEVFVKLPRWLIRLESDTAFESWNAFSDNYAVVFSEYQLRHEIDELDRNTTVQIIDVIPEGKYSYHHDGCYVVLIDGEIGYMYIGEVSDTEYSIPVYNGGSSSGGSSGGSSGDVWTPPAL